MHGDEDTLEMTRIGLDDDDEDDEYETSLLPARMATVFSRSFGSRRADDEEVTVLSMIIGSPVEAAATVRQPSQGV